MKNVNVVKWVARNLLVDLRFAFICYSAATKEGSTSRSPGDGIAQEVMNGLGQMLLCKEAVMLINKNTYISSWFFYRMLEVLSPQPDQLDAVRRLAPIPQLDREDARHRVSRRAAERHHRLLVLPDQTAQLVHGRAVSHAAERKRHLLPTHRHAHRRTARRAVRAAVHHLRQERAPQRDQTQPLRVHQAEQVRPLLPLPRLPLRMETASTLQLSLHLARAAAV